jgi:acyl-CoA dehydrogenase
LSKIRFHDYSKAYDAVSLPNVNLFKEQIALFKESLFAAGPDEAQQKDIDFLLNVGELFTLVVYGQLILENAKIYNIGDDMIDQIFEVLVADFSRFSLELYSKSSSRKEQMEYALKMIKKPIADKARSERIWTEQVYALKGAYEMKNPQPMRAVL